MRNKTEWLKAAVDENGAALSTALSLGWSGCYCCSRSGTSGGSASPAHDSLAANPPLKSGAENQVGWDTPTSRLLRARTPVRVDPGGGAPGNTCLPWRAHPCPPKCWEGSGSPNACRDQVHPLPSHVERPSLHPALRSRLLAPLLPWPMLTGLCGLLGRRASRWRGEEEGRQQEQPPHLRPHALCLGGGSVHRDCSRDKWRWLVALRGRHLPSNNQGRSHQPP